MKTNKMETMTPTTEKTPTPTTTDIHPSVNVTDVFRALQQYLDTARLHDQSMKALLREILPIIGDVIPDDAMSVLGPCLEPLERLPAERLTRDHVHQFLKSLAESVAAHTSKRKVKES